MSSLIIALVGNPNVGKSTLFNALTGLNRRTGNFAGVTVDWEAGRWELNQSSVELLDLPGTYSMAARSPDEAVVVNTLQGKQKGAPTPSAVLAIVDASNPERNLYLLSQVLEQGLPTVVALNMIDVAEERGLKIDAAVLSKNLGVAVIPVQANIRSGLQALSEAMEKALEKKQAAPKPDTSLDLESKSDAKAIQARYAWSRRMLVDALQRPQNSNETFSDKVDRVLTHKLWGSLIFFALMTLVFQSIYTWSAPVMNMVDSGVAMFSKVISGYLPPGSLKSLILDGVIAGVGSVIIFLPQIAILFFFVAVMEGCGYMARAAFIMDRLFSKIGLSGRSFIPMFSSFACAVPGVMATRTIEDKKERLITMLIAPLMSCSARLPVYTIMIGAFVPGVKVFGPFSAKGLTLLAMYLLGLGVSLPVAWLLKKRLMPGVTPAFIMELPAYKTPEWRTVFSRVWGQCKNFIVRAGTVIFSVTVLVWALAYYPRMEKSPLQDANKAAAVQLSQSWLGRMGHRVEPVFKPLGWDWRISVGAIASFPAREVIIATMGTIFNLGANENEHSQNLRDRLKKATWPDGRPLFNTAVALSIMVFFALCAQCAATLAVIRKESGSWKWPAFTFAYMTTLAYLGALVTYQIAFRLLV